MLRPEVIVSRTAQENALQIALPTASNVELAFCRRPLKPINRHAPLLTAPEEAIKVEHEGAKVLFVRLRAVTSSDDGYNFVRRHQTLRMPPALKAHITDNVWTLEEILNLTET